MNNKPPLYARVRAAVLIPLFLLWAHLFILGMKVRNWRLRRRVAALNRERTKHAVELAFRQCGK